MKQHVNQSVTQESFRTVGRGPLEFEFGSEKWILLFRDLQTKSSKRLQCFGKNFVRRRGRLPSVGQAGKL